MINYRICVFSIFFFSFSKIIIGQNIIYLENPSFEDIPRAGAFFTPPIKGWYDCGIARFPGETPPDIHPVSTAAWNVTTKAIDGQTYLGMVTRDNASWESISQALETELIAEKCYSFNAHLCVSPTYKSRTKASPDNLVNFSNPVVLLIWGGNEWCEKSEILAQSSPVNHTEWRKYEFEFWPEYDYGYITLEAFYVTPILETYNGHILLDGLSPIEEISCD